MRFLRPSPPGGVQEHRGGRILPAHLLPLTLLGGVFQEDIVNTPVPECQLVFVAVELPASCPSGFTVAGRSIETPRPDPPGFPKSLSHLSVLQRRNRLFPQLQPLTHRAVYPSQLRFLHQQIPERESVTLICEDENRSAGWTVRRNTTRKPCGDGWGENDGSTCYISVLFPWDTGLYWCESGSSNSISSSSSSSSSCSIQLSVSGSVILQSPVLPVMEGDDVTLSCRARNPTHNLPAAFYKDGSFIGDGSAGSMTLLHVSSSDEGLYKCSISGSGESPSSRVSVKDKPITSSAPSSKSVTAAAASLNSNPSPFTVGLPVFIHLVVFCPYFISTLLLVSLYRHKDKGNHLPISVVMSSSALDE
ncbi:uncharacterized protein LOC129376520 [Poeciliopsis prolifica]|uniref:uncharacterized protein LOC129376520 n=1 Tax=Poeciliopsis prolifica TaxID=188132 RepID=UPI0024143D83|nr:uncharacterized protein LOC129376520 [Poeciliopsis prolifica]